jgi:xylulokinase
VTDPCTAASTALYVDDTEDYSSEALRAAGLKKEELPRIQPAGTKIARLKPDTAQEWGLSPDTWIVAGTNDQYAGALGAGNCRRGIVTETTGTCLALVTLCEQLPEPMPAGLLGGRFPITRYNFALAYAKTAGLLLDWYLNAFCPDRSLRDLDLLAASIPAGSNGITVLPHFDGMISPTPNPDARGFICNLSLNHSASDLYRAVLESISFCFRENIELLKDTGFHPEVVRSIGGGAKSDLWLQMKADVTGLPVERPLVTEAATLGAAMLAAVGLGEFSSLTEASQTLYRSDRTFDPSPEQCGLYQNAYAQYRELCRRIYLQ